MTLHFTEPPSKEGIPADSGTNSVPSPMSALSRIALIAALGLAFAATLVASWPLTGWLKQVIKIPRSGYVSYNEIVAEMLSRTALIVVWSLPLLVLPQLRDIGSFRLPRTWTPLLLFPILALNIYFFGRFPVSIPLLAHFTLACDGVLPAVVEELVFRGYAFRRFPKAHPRLVVLTSSACFTLVHLVNVGTGSVASGTCHFPICIRLWLELRSHPHGIGQSRLVHACAWSRQRLVSTGNDRWPPRADAPLCHGDRRHWSGDDVLLTPETPKSPTYA